ncbi:hypothetical protein K490DRAFT_68998 [Saccharata proteae CBS 121410]|uniref:Uncharacterized protein n=1 Tax=Saccharata proteae CBS 121410 TaxID=1314787 RepID=A0A9P4HRX4_9PEZI|nr:hypothetical protein K490DRAFT_68998 [Saccharata proteae CBS 121410]
MAEIASIIQVVAWGTRLSLSLYDFAISCPAATRDANRLAKSVSLFALMLKQVGTSLKEDSTIPSVEAAETVQDVTIAANDVFAAVQAVLPSPRPTNADAVTDDSDGSEEEAWDDRIALKCRYLLLFVDSLNSTLSVMLQAFYTVRVIAWSRSRGDRLPAAAADAVINERSQLRVIVIEQQLLLLETSAAYEDYRRNLQQPDVQSEKQEDEVTLDERIVVPSPRELRHYQEQSLRAVPTRISAVKTSKLVRNISSDFSAEMLARWTRLQDIERRLSVTDEEDVDTPRQGHLVNEHRGGSRNPEPSKDGEYFPSVARTGPENVMSPKPHRPPSLQINDMERGAHPAPMTTPNHHDRRSAGPVSPMSSYGGVSPTSSTYFAGTPSSASKTSNYTPASPRSSQSSLNPSRSAGAQDPRDRAPATNAAAGAGLGIPWRLWLQSNRWDFVDDKVINTNSQVPLEQAFNDRAAWTEMMQRWVRREAIEEGRYSFNQVQKEVPDATGRTNFETCFCIGKGLTFPEVKRLVDRTIEIYRRSYPPPPPPPPSSQHPRVESSRSHQEESHTSSRRSRGSRRYESSTTSSSDSEYRRRPSRHGRSSSNKHRQHSRKESSRSSGGGSKTFSTMAKVGGIAALLEGLPEILSGL